MKVLKDRGKPGAKGIKKDKFSKKKLRRGSLIIKLKNVRQLNCRKFNCFQIVQRKI